jgi:hypothetical protein
MHQLINNLTFVVGYRHLPSLMKLWEIYTVKRVWVRLPRLPQLSAPPFISHQVDGQD